MGTRTCAALRRGVGGLGGDWMSNLTTTLPGGPAAPGMARAALAERFADGIDPACADTLKLLSSEVVTNCVEHAGADASKPIELRAWMLSGCIHVEVSTDARPFRYVREGP